MVSRIAATSTAVIGVVGREYVFELHNRAAGLKDMRFESNAHLKNDRYALLIRFTVADDRRTPFRFAAAILTTARSISVSLIR